MLSNIAADTSLWRRPDGPYLGQTRFESGRRQRPGGAGASRL